MRTSASNKFIMLWNELYFRLYLICSVFTLWDTISALQPFSTVINELHTNSIIIILKGSNNSCALLGSVQFIMLDHLNITLIVCITWTYFWRLVWFTRSTLVAILFVAKQKKLWRNEEKNYKIYTKRHWH